MLNLAYFRIFGYVLTLTMHTGNTIVSKMALRGEIMNDPDIKNMAAMEYCYFTVWNIAFQMLYAAFGLYCDGKSLKYGNDQDKTLLKYIEYRRQFFGTVVWPSTMLTVTIFWPIFLYDRELLFPEFIDRVFSKYTNYIMHGAILPVVLWEMVFLPRSVPRSHRKSLIYINYIFVAYFAWISYVNATSGLWPYAILHQLKGIYLPCFFLLANFLLHLHYFTQWPIVRFVWGNMHDVKSS
ncbi:hypothetical protein ABMA27_010975 [Loxostege sticticalis]|uniref:Androgen-dependent TFPI-regulating protein-like n=1 Tax=Loxostege sticticalis TaxID=481309 RepID=A0ABR3H2X0_LOXSC